MASLEWPSIFPELELQTGYTSFDLMDTDLGRVLNILKNDDPDASQYGFLPYMVYTWPRIREVLSVRSSLRATPSASTPPRTSF